MARHTITLIPGDGIGYEVSEAARRVIDATGVDIEWDVQNAGLDVVAEFGQPMPDHVLESIRKNRVAIKGPLTTPVGKGFRSVNVALRRDLDLFALVRPCKSYPGVRSRYSDVDLVIIRENTEDLYAGVEFSPVPEELSQTLAKLAPAFAPFKDLGPDDYAISCKINTRKGSERIVRAAFEFARTNNRKKVTVVHKANVVRASDGVFLEEARKVAKAFPEIAVDEANVDAICMWLLKNPANYDVLVAPNLYGDIISDLCAQMVGGLGFGCSGNIGVKLGVFEPSHGSAPKYTGQNKVNPIATILAAKMMLDWLGEGAMGRSVEAAVAKIVKEGKVRTYDMGGASTCLEMGEAVARALPKD